ncbi:MAG: recombination protein RecR [Bdellovibrio sp.]|nr:MAG: recombination protein RecR [Bdellovibrio sp.]
MGLSSLDQLIHELTRLPGIGPRTAQRLAYYILRSKDHLVDDLCEALQQLKEQVRECPECFSYTEGEGPCMYCRDPLRSNFELCVVEMPSDIEKIESSGVFKGRYHVLHGVLSPLEGVTPKDLKIDELLSRLDGIKEVIFALDADLEGDTTVLYLSKILVQKGIKVTRIAHGVPIGGHIDYIDKRTLGRAIENRVQV